MIDLHLHLDGSLSAATVLTLAKEYNVSLPCYSSRELKHYLTAPDSCRNLNDYLTRFALPLSVLMWPQAMEYAVKELARALKEQGVIYAEIRFAPQLCTKKGYSQRDIVEAAVKGTASAERRFGIKTQLILCCMRGRENKEENLFTVELAAQFLHKGVAAVDLAGAEALYATETFRGLFEKAFRLSVPFTIHAGEADGPDSIRAALSFGARRIGHGVRAREDEGLLEQLKNDGVFLEMCPKSNVQTKAVDCIREHPALDYLRMGIKVGINTDNMTVSNTCLKNEFELLRKNLSMTPKEEQALLQNSADAAFLPQKEKQNLKKEIDLKFGG